MNIKKVFNNKKVKLSSILISSLALISFVLIPIFIFLNPNQKYNLSPTQQNYLKYIKTNLNNIVKTSKNLPVSEEFLKNLNDQYNKVNKVKTSSDYWKIFWENWGLFFKNYDFWKQAFENKSELVVSQEDKQMWNKLFFEKSKSIFMPGLNKKIETWNYNKDFYIYKIKEQIKLYEKYSYYLQPLERLQKLLNYYQNNYEEYVSLQWGIDKDGKFSLDSSKYYSGNYQKIKINDEYIKNWLKYYQRWNWVFVKPEDQISKIEDKDIKALQIDEKFKNNKIIGDYIKRQINFAPDDYHDLWTINPQHPEKVNINDVKKQDPVYLYPKYKNIQTKTVEEINKLNSKFTNFQITDFNLMNKKIIDKEYEFFDQSVIKNFNYEKFFKYQNFVEISKNGAFGSDSAFNSYNNLLWNDPNLFSDAHYRSFYSELINPVHRRTKKEGNDYLLDNTTSLTDEEIKQGKSTIKDAHWINPISEYKRWFNHWKEVLPNVINKNWETKTKIKAVAYYIATNSLYLFPIKKQFNYNGYGFYNPAQIFTNDPEIQCVGYSMNLAAALTILNIPVRILSGPVVGTPTATFAEGGHAWNEVYVDGRWKVIDLTNWDLNEKTFDNKITYELKDDEDLFLERNSEWMNQLKLDISSYQTTLMFFKNPKEYEYIGLPDSI
ncbi:Uncharacterised protein [Mycoplasmopsis citelli]|uniref:Transglutaminase-like domain-containing protein n=1 Tax=Mycoplasmopsis citelli TaxID=171281 RepID=A0A449B128_9BACT|nr:transglutaminase-like domain-containing protein [Mycoplasmopsis citelli]VEU74307.1 Uncharacterised protein [Mycoplasmopsis citelli]